MAAGAMIETLALVAWLLLALVVIGGAAFMAATIWFVWRLFRPPPYDPQAERAFTQRVIEEDDEGKRG